MTLLYLGLDPTRYKTSKALVHYPIIEIVPLCFDDQVFVEGVTSSVILLTSRIAAKLFFSHCRRLKIPSLDKKLYLAVGKGTAALLPHALLPQKECQEGVITLLEELPNLQGRTLFYPHSAKARLHLKEYLEKKGMPFIDLVTYTAEPTNKPFPYDSEEFDEIVFTSPSTVDAFFEKKMSLSSNVELTTIGPITKNRLQEKLKKEREKDAG